MVAALVLFLQVVVANAERLLDEGHCSVDLSVVIHEDECKQIVHEQSTLPVGQRVLVTDVQLKQIQVRLETLQQVAR